MNVAVCVGYGQNPQAQGWPSYQVNAAYTNGVAPGYAPTAGSGLNLTLGPGTVNCLGAIETYAGGSFALTASATNYIYLNVASSCAPAVKTTSFNSTDIPLATVIAGSSLITSIVDDRTPFTAPSTSNGNVTVSGIPTNGQYAQWISANQIQGISQIPYSALSDTPSIPGAGACTTGQYVSAVINGAVPTCSAPSSATVQGWIGASVYDAYGAAAAAQSAAETFSANAANLASGNIAALQMATNVQAAIGSGVYDAAGAAAAVQASSLQKTSNLSDLASASTARTNLGLGSAATQASSAFDAAGAAYAAVAGSMPGNAATATALAATPGQCPAGQIATGVTATGTANCGYPFSFVLEMEGIQSVVAASATANVPVIGPYNTTSLANGRALAFTRSGTLGNLTVCLVLPQPTTGVLTVNLQSVGWGNVAQTTLQTVTVPIGASCTGAISGTTLTVSGTVTGTVAVGQSVNASGGSTNVLPFTQITGLGTGSGGAGTYTVNLSQTVTAEGMNSAGCYQTASAPATYNSGTPIVYQIVNSATASSGTIGDITAEFTGAH